MCPFNRALHHYLACKHLPELYLQFSSNRESGREHLLLIMLGAHAAWRSSGSLFMLFYNKQSFSRGAIEYHCPMVPFISVIVFIELLISEIFRGIVEVCHSKRKFISLSDFMIKFDKLSLKQKTATWRRRMTNGLNFIVAIENRESLNISKWRILCICTCPIIILLNAKVVMWCTKCNLLFLNV